MQHVMLQNLRSFLIGCVSLMLIFACQMGIPATSLLLPSAIAAAPTTASTGQELSVAPAQLPPLPYDKAALEPYIDSQTMTLHHDKHHAAYVTNLNNALKSYPDLQSRSVEALLRDLEALPAAIRTTVRNNGGGHLNHTMFWQIMAPNSGGQPTGAIATAINQAFGSFDQFKQQFNQAGAGRFGSGWVWLVRNAQGTLEITTTANQDSPIMAGQFPLLGNDVWEHAYYLKYQNRRAEYLDNWWNVVNWAEVNRRWQQTNS